MSTVVPLRTSAISFADPGQKTTPAPFAHALVQAAQEDGRIVGDPSGTWCVGSAADWRSQNRREDRERKVGFHGAAVHRPLSYAGGVVDRIIMSDRIIRHVEDQFIGTQRPCLVRARVDRFGYPPVRDERIGAWVVRWSRLVECLLDEWLT
jgi:hypothetical protein